MNTIVEITEENFTIDDLKYIDSVNINAKKKNAIKAYERYKENIKLQKFKNNLL